jgi:hypothetical protein
MVMCSPITLKSGGHIFHLSMYDTCPSLTTETVTQSKSYYQKFIGISGLKKIYVGAKIYDSFISFGLRNLRLAHLCTCTHRHLISEQMQYIPTLDCVVLSYRMKVYCSSFGGACVCWRRGARLAFTPLSSTPPAFRMLILRYMWTGTPTTYTTQSNNSGQFFILTVFSNPINSSWHIKIRSLHYS